MNLWNEINKKLRSLTDLVAEAADERVEFLFLGHLTELEVIDKVAICHEIELLSSRNQDPKPSY